MPGHTYLFIDGEYLRQIHRKAMTDFFDAEGELDLTDIMQHAGAHRAYLYDSIDDELRTGETEEQRAARVRPLEEFFARVRALAGFHVRLGTVTGRNKKRRRQKEVDVLLAVDMLTHGFNGSMEKAVLLAGDLDFRPIVETLVRNGLFVHVWYDGTSIAEELPGAADHGAAIHFRTLYLWNSEAFRKAHRIPVENRDVEGPFVPNLVQVGVIDGCETELHHINHGPYPEVWELWIRLEPGQNIAMRDSDRELLLRYAKAQYGPIEWRYSGDEIRVAAGR